MGRYKNCHTYSQYCTTEKWERKKRQFNSVHLLMKWKLAGKFNVRKCTASGNFEYAQHKGREACFRMIHKLTSKMFKCV